jgi:hypothetical protein
MANYMNLSPGADHRLLMGVIQKRTVLNLCFSLLDNALDKGLCFHFDFVFFIPRV